MRLHVLCIVGIGLALLSVSARAVQEPAPMTIHAARLLDGTGKVLENATIEVRGGKITAVDQRKGPYTHDLGNVTLLPGLIDVHVHIDWHFQPNGLYGFRQGNERETPEQAAAAIQKNLDDTLNAGFTTIQTLGARGDKELRDAIAAGTKRGPRILTSLGQIQPGQQTPEQLRQRVRQLKTDGADVIKVFASGSIRDGGKMNVTQEQLDAVCGEAKAQGLRSAIHAHDPASIIGSVNAGCSQIEHGVFADDAAIAAMKKANVFFDPNIGLVLQNYIENKKRFLGIGNYTEDGFAFMEKAVPTNYPMFKRALAAKVRMPHGTDAVAGAHGQNAREAFVRVKDGGQPPMQAVISATSLAAESLGLGASVGRLAPGYAADIIAVNGSPDKDILALGKVTFVVKTGKVEKKGQ